jgi:hypothetical protein
MALVAKKVALAGTVAGGAGGLLDAFHDYEQVNSESTEYFHNALDNISTSSTAVNNVSQSVNSLQHIVGAVEISAVTGGVVGGLAGYLLLNSVKDRTPGNVYLLDNSYNIGFNTIGCFF